MRALQLWALCSVACLAATSADANHHHHHHHVGDGVGARLCGVDHPALSAHLRSFDKHVKPQEYRDADERRRQLQYSSGQTYDATSFLLDLDQADAAGKLQPIRMTLLWDVVDAGDVDSSNVRRQCISVGQTVTVRDTSGGETTSTCTGNMIVAGASGLTRGNLMRQRAEAARLFWQRALKLRPVQDAAITIDSRIVSQFGLSTTSVASTDIAIIMTARPSPLLPVAGYASVLQRDQKGRPTVAWFNVVPELLNTDSPNNPDVISSEMHTALHELVHALGGLNPVITTGAGTQTSMFLNSLGQPINPSGSVYIEEIDARFPTSSPPKMVSKIKTKRVLNITREAFACPNATGLALEDVTLGAGSHWEARVMGPELMSYGSLSGQVYLSDLTLAWLEDSGQYKANYSVAGKLSPSLVDDFAGYSLGVPDAIGTSKRSDYGPGWPRWGRGEGCSFLEGLPRTSWPKRYSCEKHNKYTCTADYKMSAVCVIKASYTSESSTASSYLKESDGTLGTLGNSACSGGSCSIPPLLRWFSSDAEAVAASGDSTARAATTGGALNALDWQPVPIGYWSCDSDTAAANSTTAGVDGTGNAGFNNFASLFDLSSDTSKIGGQARCPSCRCFESSLLEYTKGFSGPGILGACMRANCYKSDYLQVGIRSQLNAKAVSWYKCPPEGGELYVVGYSGHLVCPPAGDFCRQENAITGVKYPESSFLWEAILWSILAGIVFLLFITCVLPCCRDRFINCLKRCCGALQFETLYDEVQSVDSKTGKSSRRLIISQSKRSFDLSSAAASAGVATAASTGDVVISAPPSPPNKRPDGRRRTAAPSPTQTRSAVPTSLPWTCSSITLLIVNIVTLLCGLGMLAAAAYAIYMAKGLSIGIPLLGTSAGVVIVSIIGLCASRKRAERGPSCWLLTFFFANILLLLILIFTLAYGLGWNNLTTFVSDNFASISPYLPPSFKTGSTEQEQIATAVAAIKSNVAAIGAIGVAVVVILLTGIIAAGLLVHYSTLSAMVTSICNNAFTLFGVIFASVGFYLLAKSGRAGNLVIVIVTVIVAGLYSLVLGICGTVAVFRKSTILLVMYAFVVVGVVAFFSYANWLFYSHQGTVETYVNGLSDDQLSMLATDLGLSLSKTQIIANLQDTLNQLAIASSIMLGVSACLLLSTFVYLHLVRLEKRDLELGNDTNSGARLGDVERAAAAAAGAEAAKMKMQQQRSHQRGEQFSNGHGSSSPVRTLRTASGTSRSPVAVKGQAPQQAFPVPLDTHHYGSSAGTAIALPVPPPTTSASLSITAAGSSRALAGTTSPGLHSSRRPVHQYAATGSAPTNPIVYNVGVAGGPGLTPQMGPSSPGVPLQGYGAPSQAAALQFYRAPGNPATSFDRSNSMRMKGGSGAGPTASL